MRVLSLFSGIGGMDLAAEALGWQTVGFVENNPYCQHVLKHYWPEVPIYDDIQAVTGEQILAECGSIDLVMGGFPCQPFSAAGQRRAGKDARALWPEMARIIREVTPCWIVGENVKYLLSIDGGYAFGVILRDLAHLGMDVAWGVWGSDAVGAPQERKRVFIVGHAQEQSIRAGLCTNQPAAQWWGRSSNTGGEADTRSDRGVSYGTAQRAVDRSAMRPPRWLPGGRWPAYRGEAQKDWEAPYTVAPNGEPGRVAMLRAIGNICLPAQIYPLLKAIDDRVRQGG